MLKKIVNNSIVKFAISKYLAFGIQMINSILIAKYLGIYYFGLYGFALLILQYLSYSNLGINYSYSVLCSDTKMNTDPQKKQILSSVINIQIVISLIIGVLYIVTNSTDIFPKYDFSDYYYLIVLIAILQHLNNLFINIFRLNNKLNEINFLYLILPMFQLIAVVIFKEKFLFYALLYATLFGNLISAIVFLKNRPIELKGIKLFDFSKAGIVLKRGFFLLFYNLTFYGIILTARTIVSHYFSIEDFALFSFSNTISTATFMLLGSLNFLFYPKLINSISLKTNHQIAAFIEKIRFFYLTLTVCIIFISLFSLPILYYFLPKYVDSLICLQIMLLAQLIINNSFGYSTLLIQRNKEFSMALFAILAIIIIITFSLIGINYINKIEIVALGVVLGVIFYNVMIVLIGSKIIGTYSGVLNLLKELFKFSLFAPIILYIVLSLFSQVYYLNISISMIVYLGINFNTLKEIKKTAFEMLVSDKKFLSIK